MGLVFHIQLLTDAGQSRERPQTVIQEPRVVGCQIEIRIGVDDRFVVNQREVKHNTGEIRDEDIAAA